MDDSSIGKKKDYREFQRVLFNLDNALKTIVNGNQVIWTYKKDDNNNVIDYYKGFNSSIGTFGGVLQYINGKKQRKRAVSWLEN